jgi:diguanylate cyclase (GGDEF)-like protein/PAS domain S-box-containing protein
MSLVAVFDLVAFFSSLAALGFVLAARRGAFRRDAVVLFGMLVILMLFHSTSNTAESLNITDRLDAVEDHIELLIPMLWGFFLYAFLQSRIYRELRGTRERDRLLLSSLPQRIFVKEGPDLKFAAVNDPFARSVGMLPDELVGKTDYDLFPEELAERFQAEDRQAMQSGRSSVEVKKFPYDGLERTYELLKAPVRGDGGDVIGVLGVFTDITERSRAREALRQSEERFRRLVDTAFDGISITELDLEADVRRLLFCNDRFVEMSGYTRDELTSCPNLNDLVEARLSEEELDRSRESIQRGEPFRTTVSWRRPDGAENVVESSAVARQEGKHYHIMSVDRDVTDRARAERSLRVSEERYRLIFENATDMISVHSVEDLSFLYANPAALRTLGYSREELVGHEALEFVHPEDRRLVEARFREGVARGEGMAEFRVRSQDGGYLWVEATGKVTPDEDGEPVALIISRDITGRVQQTEELRALAVEDPLTHVNNRRGFVHLADQQIRFAHRTKSSLLLFFVDVDNMKWINDNLGHKEGDLALIETANVLREVFRESDIIGRMGGDEFAVLAIEARESKAVPIVDRLRERVEARNSQPDRSHELSVSIGIAAYDPEAPIPLDELIARADSLMYEDKRKKAEESEGPGNTPAERPE